MTLDELLNICISEKLIDLTVSGVKNKKNNCSCCNCEAVGNGAEGSDNKENTGSEVPSKIKVRPIIIKSKLCYQVSQFAGTKVLHLNLSKEEVIEMLKPLIENNYKQAQFSLTDAYAQVLSGKKGTMTIKYKKSAQEKKQKDLSHNRVKTYIIKEGTPVDFMVDLGVMTNDGKIVRQKYDKYRQINRFLEFVEDILPQLDKSREQTIIDFGCGKSYLTFAMYYYLKVLNGYDIRIIGLDLKEDVINTCNRLKDKYGYDKLNFYQGDIATYKDVEHVDMVVTLHACDTATDYALAKAVKWGAKVILSVPCCQHEANSMIKNELLSPVFSYGILKERMSAIFTDAIRAGLLQEAGYNTQILEFIDMEHTPKNLLIRAVYTGKKDEEAGKRVREMEAAMNLELTLNKLI